MNLKMLTNIKILLYIILGFITFSPLLFTGFLTADDAERHLEVLNSGIFGGVWGVAEATSRLTLAFHIFLTHIPYLSDNFLYRKSFLILPHILTLAYFGYVLKNYLQSNAVALVFIVFFMVFLTNSWEHNLYASYPFAFHVSMLAVIGSAHLLYIYTKNNNIHYLWSSAILYGFAIAAYEQFTVYVVFFLGFLYYQKRLIKKENFSKIIRISFPFVLILLVYISLVIGFKYLFQGRYEGTQFAKFNILSFLITIKTFIYSSLPIYVPLKYESQITSQVLDYKISIYSLIENFKFLWALKIIISSTLITFALKQSNWKERSYSTLKVILIIIILLIFSIFLISLSSKYQNWVIFSGTIAYSSSTYFAQFFAAALVSVLLCTVASTISVIRLHPLTVFLCTTLLLTPIVAVTEYHNNNLLTLQINSANKWKAIDSLSGSGALRDIPPGSIIYAPEFMQTGGIASMREGYWSSYLRGKYGIHLDITAERDRYLSHEYFDKRYTISYKTIWPFEYYTVNIIKDSLNDYEYYIKNYELNGFYNEEKRGGVTYRWSKNTSSLSICNSGNNATNLSFSSKVNTDKLKEDPLRVCILRECRDYLLSSKETSIQENRLFPPGCSKVTFATDASAVHAPSDSRSLYFQIYNIEINKK